MFPYVIRSKKYIIYWTIFLILMFSLVLLILFKKYDDEISFVALNENNYIKILIKEEDIINLPNKIIIDNKKYNYEINKVSEEYYTDNEINYKMLTISSDYKTMDKIINIKFVRGETRIFDKIIKIIKGGLI